MRDAGVDRAVLVGHSMGGPVALTFLRLFPAKAKALVLVDADVPQTPKDDAAREQLDQQMDAFAQRWRRPNYKESAAAMIESMFSDKTTPAMRDEIRTKMLATPQHVIASAFEGMFAIEPPKPGETYTLPVMAIMSQAPRGASRKAQFRTLFPNLRYEGWQGSGHFLMMESPEKFNRGLEEFLGSLRYRGLRLAATLAGHALLPPTDPPPHSGSAYLGGIFPVPRASCAASGRPSGASSVRRPACRGIPRTESCSESECRAPAKT